MVINKPERIMKVLKYSLIPAGYIMNIAGKLIKKQHIELLGHYLTCSGKDYTLDPKVLAKVIENEKISEAYIEVIPICEIKYAFTVLIKGSNEINNILGKFILFINENGEAYIIDEYKFYPCQDIASFETSKYNVMWADIDLISKTFFSKKIPNRLQSKFIRFNVEELDNKDKPFSFSKIAFNKSLYCGNSIFRFVVSFASESFWINISFLDKFFYFLGKRFNVKTNEFKLSERRFNYLIKEWNKLFEFRQYNNIFDQVVGVK